MRASVTIIFALFVLSCLSIPFHDQIALVNSLEVGRDEEPMVWSCVGCDASNKPISSTIIEEKIVETRAILSVYSEYSVLAFRYTANIKNIQQDILWAIQVDFLSFSIKTNTLVKAVKFRRKWTTCGVASGMRLSPA